MDFGEVLTKAWKIIWKFKVLWIFGVLASCGQGSGGGGGGGSGNSGVRFSEGDLDLPPGVEDFFWNVENFFSNIQAWQGIAMVLGFLLFILLLTLFFAALNTVGRIGLIQGTVNADEGAESMTFSELFESGKPFFWRIIGFNFLFGIAIFIIIMVLVVPIVVFGAITVIGLACLVPFICLLAPLGWIVSVIVEQVNIAIVVEDLNIIDGIKHGWGLFRENIANMLVMGLILGIGGVVVGFVMALPFIFIVIPVVISVIGGTSGSEFLFGGGIFATLICFAAYLPVIIVLGGILQSYIKSAWTLTYLRLSGKVANVEALEEPMPEEDLE